MKKKKNKRFGGEAGGGRAGDRLGHSVWRIHRMVEENSEKIEPTVGQDRGSLTSLSFIYISSLPFGSCNLLSNNQSCPIHFSWGDMFICSWHHSSWCSLMVPVFWVGGQGSNAKGERLDLCTSISFCFKSLWSVLGPQPQTSMSVWLLCYLLLVNTHLQVKFRRQSRQIESVWAGIL